MSRIVWDFLWRLRYAYMGLFAAHFFIERYAAKATDGAKFVGSNFLEMAIRSASATLPVFRFQILLFTCVLLPVAVFRRAKVLMLLPLATRQVAHALWIGSVLIPGLIFGATSLFCWLEFSGAGAPAPLPSFFLSFLMLGGAFGTLAVLSRPGKSFSRVRAVLTGLWFVPSFIGWWLVQDQQFPGYVSGIAFVALAAVTAVGWLCRENSLVQAAGVRWSGKTPAPSNRSASTFRAPGGLRYYVIRTMVRSTVQALVGLILAVCFIRVNNEFNLTRTIEIMSESGALLILIAFQLLSAASPVRFLRTLPISSLQLTALAIVLPLACVLSIAISFTVIGVALQGPAVAIPMMKSFLLIISLQAFASLVILWRGLDTLAYALIFLAIIAAPLSSVVLPAYAKDLPNWSRGASAIILGIFAFATAYRLITRSSLIYKVRANPLDNWTRPS